MKKCGHVGIVGRPNVGKSTLFNSLIGKHIASVSFKPQTTRHRILGIHTRGDYQFVFVDTPGIHQGGGKLINQTLNRTALNTMQDVDVIYWMVDVQAWTQEDEAILKPLREVNTPVMVLLNKIDLLSKHEDLLPVMAQWSGRLQFAELLPICAKDETNLDSLLEQTACYLPQSDFLFPRDTITDRDELFLAAEIIREGIFHYLSSEVPYACHVTIEQFEDYESKLLIRALIWVETDGQKKILIGRKGDRIKQIGIRSRVLLEKLFQVPIELRTWVKVKQGWQNDPIVVRRYE